MSMRQDEGSAKYISEMVPIPLDLVVLAVPNTDAEADENKDDQKAKQRKEEF